MKQPIAGMTKQMVITLFCKACDETLDSGTRNGFITKDEWETVPEIIRCPACGTIMRRPANPWKGTMT